LFGWLFALFGLFPAIVGTVVGAYVPYWFVDMYVRGVIGEVWATAFLFAVLFFIEQKKYTLLAISIGFLILSHNIMAMVYSPFILLYMCIRNRRALWAFPLGVGFSAFFWLPALWETKYVVGLNTVNFREHFVEIGELLVPSWGTEFSGTGAIGNKISFQIGIIPLVVIGAGLVVYRKVKNAPMKILFKYLSIVFTAAIVLMVSFSSVIWEFIKPLAFIQYPWRLLALVIPVASFSAAFWVTAIKKKWLGIILGVLAIVFAYSYAQPVLYEPRNEAYYMSRSNFTDGTSSMGNSFSTIWTGWKDTRATYEVEIDNGSIIKEIHSRYLDKEYSVQMDKDGIVTINTLYFPGWVATVDTKEKPIEYKSDGVIHVLVPVGVHTVRVVFTDTTPRKTGNIISFFSFAVILSCGILLYRKKI